MTEKEILDLCNGLFEVGGGISIIPSIVKLYKDKKVYGVNWTTVFFFTAWGGWNLYFYPKNHMLMSFWGGIFLVLANGIWLSMLIYFQQKQKYTMN